jgi:hypothetical protein
LKSDFYIVPFLIILKGHWKFKKKGTAEFDERRKLPRIKVHTPILVQQAKSSLRLFLNLSKVNTKDRWLHTLVSWMKATDLRLLLGVCMAI